MVRQQVGERLAARYRSRAREQTRSLESNVRRNAFWSMATTMLVRIANIAVTAVVARILDPHDFGVFAVATTVFSIVSAFSELGITSCMSRTDIDADACAPTMLTVSIVSNFAIAGLMIVFAQAIATDLGSSDGADVVRVMGLVVIINGISAVPTGQSNREFKQNRLFLANTLSFVPSTIVLIVLAKTGSGAMAFAWSRVAAQGTSYLIVFISTPKKYWVGMSRYALSILWRLGFPLAMANFVSFVLQNVDYVFIGHVLGATMLGIYVLAFNVSGWSSTLLIGVLNHVAMPAFTEVKHDATRLAHAIATSLQAMVLIAAPMCTLVIALSQPLVLTLYGTRWAAAATPLAILSLYGLIFILSQLFVPMLTALGEPKFVLIVQIIWLAALIPAMAIGVHWDGITGAAIAHIVVVVPLVLPCYIVALKRLTGISLGLLARAVFPPLAAATLAAFAARAAADLFQAPILQLVIGMTIGSICYLVLAAPQLIRLMGRDRVSNPRTQRIIRAYSNVARTFGISSGWSPQHARRRPGRVRDPQK